MVDRPSFLITIDTEGDNLWGRPQAITTRNAVFLPRFQHLCEKIGFKPTYLTNYEMAIDPFFVEFGRDIIRRGAGEIGMHLHAWNSPPIVPLTTNDFGFSTYLVEYPDNVMEEKIAFMTDLLEDNFGVKMISHRAGRWAFDERYARLLIQHGYLVDCSVTPGLSWKEHLGAPGGLGGSDYRRFPNHEYFLDLSDISKPGNSPLLELPMTISKSWLRQMVPWIYENGVLAKFANKLSRKQVWLRLLPRNGWNRDAILELVHDASRSGQPYIEFMLHSSELMPGGSPAFPDETAIEKLFDDLEYIFRDISGHFDGATLAEYRTGYQNLAKVAKVKEGGVNYVGLVS